MEVNCAHLFWYDIDENRAKKVEFGSMHDVFFVADSGSKCEVYMATCDGSLVLLDGDSVHNLN
jgi:hypothetical protein